MSEESFFQAIQSAAKKLTDVPPKEIVLLHHNDTDGLSSAAILSASFRRNNLSFRRYCLEKPYPIVLRILMQDSDLKPGSLFIFTDFASGMLQTISEINSKLGVEILVLDHHSIQECNDTNITCVNPLAHGITGIKNCSASAVCYLFSKALHEGNIDLAPIALLGAIGDGMLDAKGEMQGINRQILDQALQKDIARQNGKYSLKIVDAFEDAQTLKSYLDCLGGVGYLRQGPDIGIKALSGGFSKEAKQFAKSFLDEFKFAFNTFARRVKFNTGISVQYFILGDEFSAMGVKTVGLVCEKLIEAGIASRQHYLIGFQEIPNQIPGLGPVSLNETKLSVRVPDPVLRMIERGKKPSVPEILNKTIAQVEGFVDACHMHAGAATVKSQKINDLIGLIEAEIVGKVV